MNAAERDELINATRDAFRREQDALLRESTARQEARREKKHANILVLGLIAALWLAIACIVCMLIWGAT